MRRRRDADSSDRTFGIEHPILSAPMGIAAGGKLAEAATNAVENERYWSAARSGDADNAGVFAGEAVGLIRDVQPAARVVADMVAHAERLLGKASD